MVFRKMATYVSDISSLKETNTNKKIQNKNKGEELRKNLNTKRKLQIKEVRTEKNNNVKKTKHNEDLKDTMMLTYQPWVIQTYGDLAKTKTITLKKYGRILRTLRGEELSNADNSKFRFWVKAKGFCIGKPPGYEVKPADKIIGRFSVCDTDEGIPAVGDQLNGSAKDPPLYVPNVNAKNPSGESVYRKVAVVENFFDIIYNVHVNLEGKPGKHAGQKRTYRTITETYAFLPREAVTHFLLGCTECQKRPRSASPSSLLPTPSPSPTLNESQTTTITQLNQSEENICSTREVHDLLEYQLELREKDCPISSENNYTKKGLKSMRKVHKREGPGSVLGTRNEQQKSGSSKEGFKLWSPVKCIEDEQNRLSSKVFLAGNADYSMPITTTYLQYMKSLGCKEEDALDFDNKHVSLVLNQFLHEVIDYYFH